MEERWKAEQREDQEDGEQIQGERCGQDEELVSDEPEQPPPPPPQPAQPSPYAEAVERKEQWQGLEAPEEPRAAAEAASPSAAAPAAAAPPPPPPPANVAIAIVAGTVAAAAATCDLREREEIGKTESPSGKRCAVGRSGRRQTTLPKRLNRRDGKRGTGRKRARATRGACGRAQAIGSVSYTHLTLPTKA